MFAYCNNNPIILHDSCGTMPSNSRMFAYAHVYSEGGKKYYTIPDDKYSKIEGLINGQAVFEHADESMGFGTYAENGCGVIALYNAMQLLNKPQALGKIEDEVFIMGGMLAGGLLGITPSSIDRYFAYNNVESTRYSTYGALENDIYEGAIVVFFVMNNVDNIWEGFHYMTAQYKNGQYEIYNMYSNSANVHYQVSLDPIYSGSVWICGYIVGG